MGIKLAVLTVSDGLTVADDWAGNLIVDRMTTAGHRIVAHHIVASSESAVRKQLVKWISDASVDVVMICSELDNGLAARAVGPLVTQRLDGFAQSAAVQCASTQMFVVPSSIEHIAMALDEIAPPVARNPRMTTGSIATIGDIAVPEAVVDLRSGARRGAWFALVSLAVAGVLTAVMTLRVVSHQHAIAAADPDGEVMTTVQETPPVAKPAPIGAPAVVIAPAPVPTVVPAPKVVPPIAKPAATRRKILPTAPLPTAEPDTQSVSEVESTCEETSCKLNNYERECCAPFRPTTTPLVLHTIPDAVDRTMVATAIANIRPAIARCGQRSSVHGTVRAAVEVQSDGRVDSVVIVTTPDPGLGECVAAAVHEATFPATEHGGSFRYPFAF